MFGISPAGWVHTIGSLPAIPAAAYMFAKAGRIVPRSKAGTIYFISMLIGCVSILPIAKEPVAYVFGVLTLAFLLTGYGLARNPTQGGAKRYIETICLTLTAFLLMVPTTTEILTRVPDGHPIASSLQSPILHAAQGSLLVFLIIGVIAQVIHLRRQGRLRRG